MTWKMLKTCTVEEGAGGCERIAGGSFLYDCFIIYKRLICGLCLIKYTCTMSYTVHLHLLKSMMPPSLLHFNNVLFSKKKKKYIYMQNMFNFGCVYKVIPIFFKMIN